jgi:hypothetical protein
MNIRFDRLRECISALRGSPTPEHFTMRQYKKFRDGCNTPACVLGHYYFKIGHPEVLDGLPLTAAPMEFGITTEQSIELFGIYGCGGATTPERAIAYIEGFIRRHEPKAQRPTQELVADLMAKIQGERIPEEA